MYQGKPSEGEDFFTLLFESDEFNCELGRVALAAGRLESELILFFRRNNIPGNFDTKTLGGLVKIGKDYNLLDNNLYLALNMTCRQRNYLVHNIHALLINSIDETILEGKNLLDSDVQTYKERARQLRENLCHFADVIKNGL